MATGGGKGSWPTALESGVAPTGPAVTWESWNTPPEEPRPGHSPGAGLGGIDLGLAAFSAARGDV